MKYEKKHSHKHNLFKTWNITNIKQKNKLKYKVVLHKLVLNKVKVIRRGDGEQYLFVPICAYSPKKLPWRFLYGPPFKKSS